MFIGVSNATWLTIAQILTQVRKFWHQTLRVTLTTVSNFITRKVLRLPRPSITERYTNILLVFTGSGLVHIEHGHIFGVYNPLGTMMFFQFQAVGIMIEDGVQELWRRYSGPSSDKSFPVWQRLVGLFWVMVVFAISSPWYLYQDALSHTENWWVIPYSFVDRFGAPTIGALIGVGTIMNWILFRPEI